MKYKNKKSQKRVLFFSTVLVMLTASLLYLAYQRFANNRADDSSNVQQVDQTTSTAPTAQADFSSGESRPVVERDSDRGEAIISDNQGIVNQTSNESTWTSSVSGDIKLYSPAQNQQLKNGDTISGESSLPAVSFRVIDDISGVISAGQLSVVNGKFSGNISFDTDASKGRLDVFGTKEDSSEFSNLEIDIKFGD
jgi:hypothetical protein